MPELSIIYVNYDSLIELESSIHSVLNTVINIEFEILVIDNNSRDNIDKLGSLDDRIKLLQLEHNLGYGAANNIGIEMAKGDYILLLNADTVVIGDAIFECFEKFKELKTENIAVLTCKHSYLGNKFQMSSYQKSMIPNLYSVFFTNPFWRIFSFNKTFIKPDHEVIAMHQKSHYTFAVQGSFFMSSRDILIENKFDTDFFLYMEELDLCQRLHDQGKKMYYFADAEILHTSQRSVRNIGIRNQIYLSIGLYILKTYGKFTFAFYYLHRVIRSIALYLCLPFMGKNKSQRIKNYLNDFRPFSRDHLSVFNYKKYMNSYKPLKATSLNVND